jgi:membrane protein required for colicin V production
MNGLDYVILIVIALSALIGLLRGFVRETVSLLAWIAAFWLGMSYSGRVAAHLGGVIASPSLRLAAAFIAIFLAVLIAGFVINYLLASLLKKAGVRTSDRVLGVVFGVARGLLVVSLAVVLVELTPLVKSPSWRGSVIVGYMQPMVGHFHNYLPGGPALRVTQAGGGIGR